MAIKLIGDYECFVDSWGNFTSLIIRQDIVEEQAEYCDKNNIKSISIRGFECQDVEFIGKFYFIEDLFVTGIDSTLLPINKLRNIKHLRFGKCKQIDDIDYNNFIQLQTLYTHVNKKYPELLECEKLEKIGLWSLKTKSKNLKEIMFPNNIVELSLIQSNIESLEGLKLSNLKKVELGYCSNLIDIQAILSSKKSIKEIDIENCKKIIDYSLISKFKFLKYLKINESGEIKSLNFIKEVPQLCYFSFYGTKVLDNDLSPLLLLDDYFYKNHKDYNFKLDGEGKLSSKNR